MKISQHFSALVLVIVTSMFLHGCGVDPLDTTTPGTQPQKGDAGYTICGDKTLPDTDGDGSNDQCEAILGTDPNKADTNGNGLSDGSDLPAAPVSNPNIDCSSTTLDATSQQWCTQVGGLANNNLNDAARSSVLASSGLNQTAPAGTKVSVDSQTIRIVYNYDTSPNNSGIESDAANVMAVCKDEKGVALTTFIYYEIVGDVIFCNHFADGQTPTCDTKSAATHATMKMCGPLNPEMTKNDQTLIDKKDFKWTWGHAVNTTLSGEFKSFDFSPVLLQKSNKSGPVELILTASDLQNSVLQKLVVNFKSTFQIAGNIYGNNDYSVSTPSNVDIKRNFKRATTTTTTTFEKTPGITGLWTFSN